MTTEQRWDALAEQISTVVEHGWDVLRGIVLPLTIAAYAWRCMVTQVALFPRTRPIGVVEFRGDLAVAAGALYLAIALGMHAHYWWRHHPRYWGLGYLGQAISLMGIIVSAFYLFFVGVVWH
jgi:hypothetical protein